MKLGKAFRNIAVLGALAALLGGFPAQAAEYPTKEIRIIQPYPSGGFNDVVTARWRKSSHRINCFPKIFWL